MAPNLHPTTRLSIEHMIQSKLDGDNGLTDKDIAEVNQCTTRTVRHIRSNMLLFGAAKAPSNGVGRPKTISPLMMTALRAELTVTSCMNIREMVTFLHKEFDVIVSESAISRALKEARWSHKVANVIAKERNEDLREEHIYERSFYHSYQMVFIDESGSDRSIGTRNKGWAPVGVTPAQVKHFHRGQRLQVLPAYTQEGVIHFRVYDGSTDAEIFEGFIEELLPYCGKWPGPRSVLIMDNASFHHTEKVTQLCRDAGVVLLYLPPYSPDFNPIERFFGELKNYIRMVWQDQVNLIQRDFQLFLEECVDVVGSRKASAEGHFRWAGVCIEEPPE